MVYVPEGFAHGFQTLEDDSELFYHMTAPYDPAASRGIRWDDPTLAIAWPIPDGPILSPRDRAMPLLAEVA
jgi:dTDP-4-dehydrorhamnose 3,5-epimerase